MLPKPMLRILRDTLVENVEALAPYDVGVVHRIGYKRKKPQEEAFYIVGGPDETRTRDPMRDRHVF